MHDFQTLNMFQKLIPAFWKLSLPFLEKITTVLKPSLTIYTWREYSNFESPATIRIGYYPTTSLRMRVIIKPPIWLYITPQIWRSMREFKTTVEIPGCDCVGLSSCLSILLSCCSYSAGRININIYFASSYNHQDNWGHCYANGHKPVTWTLTRTIVLLCWSDHIKPILVFVRFFLICQKMEPHVL